MVETNVPTGSPTLSTVELSAEVDLRRLRFFVGRLDYLRPHMSGGDLAQLDVVRGGGSADVARAMDEAIDRARRGR